MNNKNIKKKPPDISLKLKNRFDAIQDIHDEYDFVATKKPKLLKNINAPSFFNQLEVDATENTRFLVMESTVDGKTLQKVSPIIIENTIRDSASGEVKNIKRIYGGKILIETKTKAQATRLLKLKQLYDVEKTNVSVTEHKTLNSSKAVAFSDEFLYLSDEEIFDGIKIQGVIDVRRIRRRNSSNEYENSKGIIFTFNKIKPPNTIRIGFVVVETQTYIPNPVRCLKCHKYNHTVHQCRSVNEPTCGNCTESTYGHNTHKIKIGDKEVDRVICNKPSKCSNCGGNHSVWSRECPHFKRASEIQKIKTELRTTLYNAIEIYKTRYPNTTNTFATITKTTLSNNQETESINNHNEYNIATTSFQPHHSSTPPRRKEQLESSPMQMTKNTTETREMPKLSPLPYEKIGDEIPETLDLSFE